MEKAPPAQLQSRAPTKPNLDAAGQRRGPALPGTLLHATPAAPLTSLPLLSPHLLLQANDEYRRYQAEWWGDAIKAEFEERKGDPQ